jgi:hypothetical protein
VVVHAVLIIGWPVPTVGDTFRVWLGTESLEPPPDPDLPLKCSAVFYREKGCDLKDETGEVASDVQTCAGISLTKLFEDCSPTDPLAPYQAQMREWAMTYLTAPHPELGREGPVCPFTASSISRETFWVGCVDRSDLRVEDIERTVSGMVTEFLRLPPMEGPGTLLKTILILFPAVIDSSKIDQAQRRLKKESVSSGLMIGQFYPECEEPGIRNPEFRPLRSPVPLLAIRHMVSSDFPFLTGRAEWIEEYLNRFAPSIPASVRSTMATKLDTQPFSS